MCLKSGIDCLDYFLGVTNFLVVEESIPSEKDNARTTEVGSSSGKKASAKRWRCIQCWHLVEPSASQLYVCSDLFTPHYQVSVAERATYIKLLKKTAHAKVIPYYAKDGITMNKFMSVVNDMTLSPSLLALSKIFTFDHANNIVERYKESDKADACRGNIFFDKGFSSAQNQEREESNYGLAGPRLRSVNCAMMDDDTNYTNEVEALLLKAMKDFLPTCCKNKEHLLYSVPPSIERFTKGKCESFQAARWAKTNKHNVLKLHCDTQNPRHHEGLVDDFMNMLVACFAVKQDDQRCTVIGYGRDSIVSAAVRYDKYGKCLKSITDFYKSIPEERRSVVPSLVKKLKVQVKDKVEPIRMKVHTDKFVYYSPYIEQILNIVRFQNINVYYTIALVYLTIMSESPDCFKTATAPLLAKKKICHKMDVYTFAYKFYKDMWDMKISDAKKRKAKIKVKPVGCRHKPTVNRVGSREGVVDAIKLMAAMHHACCLLPSKDVSDMFYFIKAVAIFSDKDKGIQHAGDLMSQHLLVIGAAVGVYPSTFMTFGEMGETKSTESMRKRFNLFTSNTEEGHALESTTILKALSFYTKETIMYCENLACKEVQENDTKTSSRWVDSFYPDQQGLYRACTQEKNKPCLEIVTENSVTQVELPKLIYPTKKSEIHHDARSMGESLFQRKTKKKSIAKRQKRKATFDENVHFTPFPHHRVITCTPKRRQFLNLDKMMKNSLGMEKPIAKKDILLNTVIKKNTIMGKHKIVRWYRMSLNASVEKNSKKKKVYKVKDDDALLPVGFETKVLKGSIFFKKKSDAREYLFMNYLLTHDTSQLSTYYENMPGDDEDDDTRHGIFDNFMIFTLSCRDGSTKKNKVPHYIMKSASKTALVVYSCDDMGRGSDNKNHWKPIKKCITNNGSKKRKK